MPSRRLRVLQSRWRTRFVFGVDVGIVPACSKVSKAQLIERKGQEENVLTAVLTKGGTRHRLQPRRRNRG
jgi:hypothetical protein